MINVLLVDDEPAVRIALRNLIPWNEHGFRISGEASNGNEALPMSREADVVLVDMKMPVKSGIDYIKDLKRLSIDPCVVVLSAYDDYHLVREAFRLGIFDYLLKADLSSSGLLRILKRAATLLPEARAQNKLAVEKTDFETFRRQYLRDLFLGTIRTQEGEKFPDLNIDFPAAVVLFRAGTGGTSEFLPEKTDLITDYLKSSMLSEISGTVVTVDSRSYVVLLNGLKIGDADAEELVLNYCRRAGANIKNLMNLEVSRSGVHSVSTVKKLEGLFHTLSGELTIHSAHVVKALRYLRQNLNHDDLDLEQTAKAANVSKNYLSALFSKECGKTFSQVLNEARIERACTLLETGSLKVYEIAEYTGYATVEHFIRTFKKITGVSPGDYRRKDQ